MEIEHAMKIGAKLVLFCKLGMQPKKKLPKSKNIIYLLFYLFI
jgi:hypothetical protein